MARQQTDRERIADALYMLAAGANHGVLMDTLRAYVVAHSKEESDVLALLRELREAQPTLTVAAIKHLKMLENADSVRVTKVLHARSKPKKPRKTAKRELATKSTHRASARE